MSDLAKWVALASALAIIVLSVQVVFNVVDLALVATGLSEAVYSFVETASEYLYSGRALLNNLATPWLWDILLWVALMYPIAKFGARVLGWVYKWIFK